MNNASKRMYAIIGAVVREAREGKGWTQKQLADKLKVNNQTVNRLEIGMKVGRGRAWNSITIERYVQACKVLDISGGELYERATRR